MEISEKQLSNPDPPEIPKPLRSQKYVLLYGLASMVIGAAATACTGISDQGFRFWAFMALVVSFLVLVFVIYIIIKSTSRIDRGTHLHDVFNVDPIADGQWVIPESSWSEIRAYRVNSRPPSILVEYLSSAKDGTFSIEFPAPSGVRFRNYKVTSRKLVLKQEGNK